MRQPILFIGSTANIIFNPSTHVLVCLVLHLYIRVHTHIHVPEEMSLLFALLLSTGEQIKLSAVGRIGKVEPSASQQLSHVLYQLEVRLIAEGCKGCLGDSKYLDILHLNVGVWE